MNGLIVLHSTKRFSTLDLPSIGEAALRVLLEPSLIEKVRLTQLFCSAWNSDVIRSIYEEKTILPACPECPARSVNNIEQDDDSIEFAEKQKKIKNMARKISIEYTIHGIANAESYAIDLFWDILARFITYTSSRLPKEFFDDIVYIAGQEAEHFMAWKTKLDILGLPFGSFPPSEGLWQSAKETSDDILSRLAIINMIHEAKGLDTYIKTREKFVQVGDDVSIAILDKNYHEEIGHVRIGVKWFNYICNLRNLDAKEEFHRLFYRYFKGKLKGPFNHDARESAGLPRDWYLPLCEERMVTD